MAASNAIHGKAAIIYVGAAGAAAIPIGDMVDWSIDFDDQIVDTTPLNSTWRQSVKGLQGYKLNVSGNFNPGSSQLFTASLDTVVNKWYLYVAGAGAPTQYYYGTGWVHLGKVAAGSTTTKASSGFNIDGYDSLNQN